MLIKNYLNSNVNTLDNPNVVVGEGTVVGINIKKCHLHPNTDDETYGIFLHVKVDNPYNPAQYDLVFDAFTSNIYRPSVLLDSTDKFSGSRRIKKRIDVRFKHIKKVWKKSKKLPNNLCDPSGIWGEETSPIVEIFDVCNVNEWVEVIGSKIRLTVVIPIDFYDANPIFMYISSLQNKYGEVPKHMMIPNMFQIYTDNVELKAYMDMYRQLHPAEMIKEYDRSLYNENDQNQ